MNSRLLLIVFTAGVFIAAGCKRAPVRMQDGFCSIGSTEFNMLMDHWSAGFAPDTQKETPSKLIHEGRGNGVAPLALLEGRCDLAPMSRKMSDAEVQSFVARYGSEPLAVPVAVDALAVVVAREADIQPLTPDDVFRTFHLGPDQVRAVQEASGNETWQAYGVNSASERYRWFKESALHGKKFSDLVLELADPIRLVGRIDEKGGIGYARVSEMNAGVKAAAIDMGFGKIVQLTPASARSGLYPFTRFFYIYLPPAGRPLHPDTLAFIDHVLSEDGQKILEPLGLYSLGRKERIYNANRLEKYRQQLP